MSDLTGSNAQFKLNAQAMHNSSVHKQSYASVLLEMEMDPTVCPTTTTTKSTNDNFFLLFFYLFLTRV